MRDRVRATKAAAGGTPITAKPHPAPRPRRSSGRLLVGAGCALPRARAAAAVPCVLRDHTKTKRAREERRATTTAILAALAAALPEVPVLVNGGVCSADDATSWLHVSAPPQRWWARCRSATCAWERRRGCAPADLADEYLDMCERHSVPSPLFIRRYLRWIFRAELEPDGPADLAARDSWRARLWTVLVRPYLETLWQFREVVRLFRHLEAGGAPTDGAPSFKSVRSGETVDDDDEAAEWQLTFE